MVDLESVVCCLCGDVGFRDKLFRCSKCIYRYQHSYCSNYYGEYAEPIQICDWCQSEERNSSSRNNGNTSSRNNYNNNDKSAPHAIPQVRSAYSGGKIKQHHHDGGGSSAEIRATAQTPSPRPGAPRKYKLLKDVMCADDR